MSEILSRINVALLLLFLVLPSCGGGGNNGSSISPKLISISVTPSNPSITQGMTLQFTATGIYSDSSTQDLTSSVAWTSSDETVATISSMGLAISAAAGSTTITARLENISGSTTMTVTKRDIALESPFGFHPAGVFKPGYTNNGYGDAQNIGVKWTRQGVYAFWFLVQQDLTKQEYDFSIYDNQWSVVPNGINILANIAPQGPIDEGYCLPGSYMPINIDKYSLFVKAVVERYDGDGIDDMPGLTNPIKYWQVGNEPSVLQKSDFAKLQEITYTAIKEACSDCTVLIGGAMGFMDKDDYIGSFNSHYKPILDALAGNYVDVMDFHWYGSATGDYRDAKAAYDYIRSVLSADGFPQIPVWITEMGSYSGDPVPVPLLISGTPIDYPLQTERQQALDYLKRFVYPLSFGVKKIFPAFGLMEGFKYDGGYFDYTGLIYDGWGAGDLGLGVKKLGYYTYKKMTEILEGSDWNNIQTIQESNDVYIYKFVKNDKPIYVAWWDYFNDPTYTPGKMIQVSLSGLQGASAIITEAVPKFATGAEVTDYATAFNKSTLATSNGVLTLGLGDGSVFVEVLK